jgi:hypothetical protein
VGAGDCSFPGSTCNVPFSSYPQQKPAAVSITHAKSVNSPSAFVALDGIGTGESVTQGNFLYARSTSPMKYRLTMADYAGGPDIVSIVEAHGTFILEFPTAGYLKLLEAMGVGTIEYIATGNL